VRLLALRELGRFLIELFLHGSRRVRFGRREARELGNQPLAALADARQRLRTAVATRFRNAKALLRLTNLLRDLAKLPNGIGDGWSRGLGGGSSR